MTALSDDPVLRAHQRRQREHNKIVPGLMPERTKKTRDRETMITGLDQRDGERRAALRKAQAKAEAKAKTKQAGRLEDEAETLIGQAEALKSEAKALVLPKAEPATAASEGDPDNPGTPDDLKLIKGIGPALEPKLNDLGISRFAQIAAWTEVDVTRFDGQLKLKDAISRNDWIGQAEALMSGGE